MKAHSMDTCSKQGVPRSASSESACIRATDLKTEYNASLAERMAKIKAQAI